MDHLLSFTGSKSGVVAAAGIIVHLIYRQLEPRQFSVALVLNFGVPLALSVWEPYHKSFVLEALRVFPLFWFTLVASIIAYRLSPWHPLAKYPGPLLGKVSKFYIAFRSLGGKQHIYLDTLHGLYGSVVRIGPNQLSICDVDAVNPLLSNPGVPKSQFFEGRMAVVDSVTSLIATKDKSEHARRRRPWARAFKADSLKGYEDMVIKRSAQLVDLLDSSKGVVNISQCLSYFAYDIMNDLAFGGGSEMMAQGDVTGLWHLMEAGQENAMFMSHVPWLGKWLLQYPQLFAKDIQAFSTYARSRVAARKAEGSSYKDIFYHLIDEGGVSNEPPTAAEIASDGGLAIVAGSDTTSTALSHLFYFLMLNPTAYRRLQAEVDTLADDIQNTSKQAHMSYLNGAINETLRLLPPVLGGSQRETATGSGGSMIGSYFLPEGTTASIATYSLHRSPRYFAPETEAFHPERWLPEEDRVKLEPKIFGNPDNFIHDTNAFIPFSHGAANCAGKNLAYMEMRMVVCMIMQRFDIELAKGYNPAQWLDDIKDYYVSVKGALPVVLTPRNLSM
ncbi:Cytochrome P450 67 [Psilocybe cubensis]|uniref:Cytochrome P450 67 n=2 Tax=Psilocybe cubensis TaxID=181762 RepID=A0ACB8GQZ4_PSICU|nr:Cytochrome P450 67 [Psilocybe cubensis]KAH9477842.1 Cytochrome P450 67 [Psilocybe cubensis]